jgi:hypothetical protein
MTPEELKRDCEICREKVGDRFNRAEQRLTALEVTLWGQRGDNGLRAAIHELRVKMDVLLRFFWIAAAIPPLTVALLAILKFIGKL